ncbi:MAG: methylthioribulose-1-phosphate dehydratase [Actinomycetales bacterium mxb001]|nr:MAG: methylthioribulose-1-phosphate dehydratase [Actinomycetales bacterium mxb001]
MAQHEELARTSRRLYDLGWMRGTSGNVSVLDGSQLFVTASGVDKSSLGETDVVEVDGHGAALPGQSLTPSAEARVHAAILEAARARAAVHVHAMSGVLAAARWPGGVPLVDVEQLKGIGRGAHGDRVTVPVVANSQDMAELSARVVQGMDTGVPCVIVAEHGIYTWGGSLEEAVARTESLDWLFEHALRLDALGAVRQNVDTPFLEDQ